VSEVLPVPGYGRLAVAPVEADVRRRQGGASAGGAGLVTVRGGAVALIRRHAVTAVGVEPWGEINDIQKNDGKDGFLF